MSTAIERFFQSLDSAGEGGGLVSHFSDPLLFAGPDGAQSVAAARFVPALQKRKLLFESLGLRPAEFVSLTETPLDARYVLARTKWRFTFDPAQSHSTPIEVESTFLFDTRTDPYRILLYVAHRDILSILRERGILSD